MVSVLRFVANSEEWDGLSTTGVHNPIAMHERPPLIVSKISSRLDVYAVALTVPELGNPARRLAHFPSADYSPAAAMAPPPEYSRHFYSQSRDQDEADAPPRPLTTRSTPPWPPPRRRTDGGRPTSAASPRSPNPARRHPQQPHSGRPQYYYASTPYRSTTGTTR